MDAAVYAKVDQNRLPIQHVFQPRHEAVVVGREKFILGLSWTVIPPDRIGALFIIDVDQPAFLFHADVA